MVDVSTLARAGYIAVFAAIFLIDLRTRIIPNAITYPAIAAATLIRPDGVGLVPLPNVLAGVVAAAIVAAFALRDWMGMGDAKLVLLIGLVSGPALTVVGIWLGVVSGGLTSMLLIATGRATRKDLIPFGPFLAAAATAALLVGDRIIEWSGLSYLFGT